MPLALLSCDGSAHILGDNTPANVLAALLTIKGGELVTIPTATVNGN